MTSNPDIEVTILEDDDEITDPSGHPRQNGDIEMASPSATGSAAQAAEVETSMDVEEVPSRVPFSEYLKSPIVSLHIGAKDARHSLSAHRALLDRSPYFAGRLAQGQTSFTHEELELDQVACFLEWLYTGDYFPRISFDGDAQAGLLEVDPSLPAVDVTGEQILKHAKVYTLAEKFGLPVRWP